MVLPRYLNNPDRLRLDLGDTDDAADAAEGLAQAAEEAGYFVEGHHRSRKGKGKRRNEAFPDHLPCHEIEAEVPEDLRNCLEHGPRILIGYDEVPQLVFKRAELSVLITRYTPRRNKRAALLGAQDRQVLNKLVGGDQKTDPPPSVSFLGG